MLKCSRLTCHLTGGEDEVVTGHIRLITEDLRLFHIQLPWDSQEPEEMIVYSHACNRLKDILIFAQCNDVF